MAAATVQVLNPMAIAGLGKVLDAPDMKVAGLLYNTLPNIRVQPRLQDQHIVHVKALLEIIQKYGMGDVFAIHSLHSHGALPVGTIRLESNVGLKGLTWTKATVIEKPDADNMHATFFKFNEDSVIPFEFAEGPSPFDMAKIPAQFISDIGTYLVKHNLTNVIALQVGNFSKSDGVEPEPTAEIEVQWGQDMPFTVVVPTSVLKQGFDSLIPTGWHVPATGVPDKPPSGEHWNKVLNVNTHKVHYSGIEPLTPAMLVKVLVEQEIIVD
ncbi:hypothetical protein C0991_006798 [Blastosporella zonata]|nr:hypothetical protein C0991_006798 [Blastosporella zonata]